MWAGAWTKLIWLTAKPAHGLFHICVTWEWVPHWGSCFFKWLIQVRRALQGSNGHPAWVCYEILVYILRAAIRRSLQPHTEFANAWVQVLSAPALLSKAVLSRQHQLRVPIAHWQPRWGQQSELDVDKAPKQLFWPHRREPAQPAQIPHMVTWEGQINVQRSILEITVPNRLKRRRKILTLQSWWHSLLDQLVICRLWGAHQGLFRKIRN